MLIIIKFYVNLMLISSKKIIYFENFAAKVIKQYVI